MTHQVDDLVDVVHEGDVGLSVWPDEKTGGGGEVVALVDLSAKWSTVLVPDLDGRIMMLLSPALLCHKDTAHVCSRGNSFLLLCLYGIDSFFA